MTLLSTRILTSIEVPDTPLITKAIALCRKHLNDLAYNHSVRTWLWGTIIASKIPELQGRDIEAHSIAAILHDLGWDETGDLVTQDKRFEVDGANAAREFLCREASDWDKKRPQLVWDAIALHTTTSIVWHKEPEVVATSYGINADFVGPDHAKGGHLTWKQWIAVSNEFPRLGMMEGLTEILCKLCRMKSETMYDNFCGQWGEKYVEGYSLEGRQDIDLLEAIDLG